MDAIKEVMYTNIGQVLTMKIIPGLSDLLTNGDERISWIGLKF